MPEENKIEEKPKTDGQNIQKLQELRDKYKQQKEEQTINIPKIIATREKLERDFQEDILEITFKSSGQTERTLIARKPSQDEMMTIMRLSAEAAIYEGRMDPDSLGRMVDIYSKLPELAAALCIDKTLDAEFWKKSTSFGTLSNFIIEVIRVTQTGGPNITTDEMKTFHQ